MIIILHLEGETSKGFTTTLANQQLVSSFIHNVLGDNNKYHDTFSSYAISSIQGGCLKGDKIEFNNGGYIQISSPNSEFLNDFFVNVSSRINTEIANGIYLKSFEFKEFDCDEYYDVIHTISPVRLKNSDDIEITIDDESFLKVLTEKTIAKLKKWDTDIDLRGFKIELYKPENAKSKLISVKDNTYTKASLIRLVIKGNKITRRVLYNLGIGQSTGCGFGSVKKIIN